MACYVLTRGAYSLEEGHRLWPFNLIESDGGVWKQARAQMIIFFPPALDSEVPPSWSPKLMSS